MALRARALYEFISENPGEISVTENELLTLSSEEVVDGWLEGTNSRGETGLFPASYVEIIRTDTSLHGNGTSASQDYYCQTSPQRRDTSNESTPTHSAVYQGHLQQQRHSFQTSQGSDEDWDDDWDDSGTADEHGGTPEKRGNQAGYPMTSTSASRRGSAQQSKSTGTVGKNLNRFALKLHFRYKPICLTSTEWQENPYSFTCTIDDPTKQTKFKGMKSYMSYGLTPSHTQNQVNRRYKHFDWLYARLVEKFPVISVPHLPEKQATGRFEEDFISKRRKGLIWWMNHMTSHPILSTCDVFQHFLTCSSNDKKAWKQGKRKAEKDDLVGANFFLTICPPALPLNLQEVESNVDGFKTFTKKMDENIIQLNVTINEFARKQITGFKKEYQRVGQAFRLLSQAFEFDQQVYSAPLNKAMAHTGEVYETIGDYFAEQPRQDLEPISDLLAIYQGHFANFPDIIHVQKGLGFFSCVCSKLLVRMAWIEKQKVFSKLLHFHTRIQCQTFLLWSRAQ
uniref:Sorting nexin 18b n=1 Tax=Sinocyclocheilus rhinocerous TaxID=307959 RepID=A0A673N537_9TELE